MLYSARYELEVKTHDYLGDLHLNHHLHKKLPYFSTTKRCLKLYSVALGGDSFDMQLVTQNWSHVQQIGPDVPIVDVVQGSSAKLRLKLVNENGNCRYLLFV